jgi:Amt family ammonium transporter
MKRLFSVLFSMKGLVGAALGFITLLAPTLALADELNSGDTAWMITATVLVLMMTIPGLSLFYAGMVRSKNVLSVMMQCFAITCLVTVIWVVYGYSMAFDTTGMEAGVVNLNSIIGGFGNTFLQGISVDSGSNIPESVFATFQLTFAIITPALIVGAFAERIKFSTMLVFVAVWVTVCYFPMVHMVWAGDGGLLWDWGVLDFAGGTVVHINAGIAGLVAAIMLGKRKGYPSTAMPPHNLTLSVIGASMLWVGWFGFNAGSPLAADGTAGMAMLVTQVATAAAAITWMFIEWIRHGKPSVLGIATGAVGGLVAITPASGSAGPMGALLIGFSAGFFCYLFSTSVKQKFGCDDSLDVFGVHGVGGIVGSLLTGLCAAEFMGGSGLAHDTVGVQLWNQLLGVTLTVVWCGVVSVVSLFMIDKIIGLRVTDEEEVVGLDITLHDEQGYEG